MKKKSTMSDEVEMAAEIAGIAHNGQFRSDGVTPYINHPIDVARRLVGSDSAVIATALLHDVVEDTDWTIGDLMDAGFSLRVIQAVATLTKTDDDYDLYLDRVKANPIAKAVKIADMIANLQDAPTEKQIHKYTKGLLFLNA
tara:strand:+ start:309 stop:734 length:426 start_codon:yes stop_codon:yes gene_type:complete